MEMDDIEHIDAIDLATGDLMTGDDDDDGDDDGDYDDNNNSGDLMESSRRYFASAATLEEADLRRQRTMQKSIATEAQVDLSGEVHHRNDNSNDALQVVIQALRASRTIKSLRLSRCRLGDSGVMALAAALVNDDTASGCALEILILHKTDMRAPGATSLAQALRSPSCTLQWLNLESNEIGNQGAMALAQALATTETNDNNQHHHHHHARTTARSSSLQVLSLAWNGLTDAAAHALAVMLRRNASLQILILRGNAITAEGASALHKAVRDLNCTLQSLDLEQNHAGSRPFGAPLARLGRRNVLLQQARDFLQCGSSSNDNGDNNNSNNNHEATSRTTTTRSLEEVVNQFATLSAQSSSLQQQAHDAANAARNDDDDEDDFSLSAVFLIAAEAMAPHLASMANNGP